MKRSMKKVCKEVQKDEKDKKRIQIWWARMISFCLPAGLLVNLIEWIVFHVRRWEQRPRSCPGYCKQVRCNTLYVSYSWFTVQATECRSYWRVMSEYFRLTITDLRPPCRIMPCLSYSRGSRRPASFRGQRGWHRTHWDCDWGFDWDWGWQWEWEWEYCRLKSSLIQTPQLHLGFTAQDPRQRCTEEIPYVLINED